MSGPTDNKVPDVGKDPGTQEMLQKAQEHFPNLEEQDALQQEANLGPGKEAAQGEGQTGILESVKQAASGVADKLKEANPATRDYTAPRD